MSYAWQPAPHSRKWAPSSRCSCCRTESWKSLTTGPASPEDFSIPVDVHVAADGSVTSAVVSSSSGNVAADGVAATYMRERKFLPALDSDSKPIDSVVKVNVNMFKRGPRKVVRVTLKPPPMEVETLRVRKLMCADFLWEVNRIKSEAGIKDFSLEVMPYMSAHMYMAGKEPAQRAPREVLGRVAAAR